MEFLVQWKKPPTQVKFFFHFLKNKYLVVSIDFFLKKDVTLIRYMQTFFFGDGWSINGGETYAILTIK